MSAAQTAAALRGVPAQFTDIATSLQSGQKPMTVLLQQGGAAKDMFGGVGAAAKAVGGYVASLVNPVTIAAAAVGGIGYAPLLRTDGRVPQNLILTGNISGLTTDKFNAMARPWRISAVSLVALQQRRLPLWLRLETSAQTPLSG